MRILKQIWSWTTTLGAAFILSSLVGIFLIQPYKVDGHSMDPSLDDQQRVYVSKLSHTFSYYPKYGDIVIIDSRVGRDRTFKDEIVQNPIIQLIRNESDHNLYIKRVIGKPGDKLVFKDRQMYRNGEPLNEPYLNEVMNEGPEQEWVVPEGHVFVMGDNRNNSEDSRIIGFVPLDHVIGIKI